MSQPLPDLERVGGLEWTKRTKGSLTREERRRLFGEVVRGQARYLAGRIKRATGRVPKGAESISVADFRPPDSRLARVAEEACGEQTPGVKGHGYRTWVFGSGLAAVDSNGLDPELFYVACLLHDYGLCDIVPGEDFTLRSAERVQRCAEGLDVPDEALVAMGDAITVHATPGVDVETDGALGAYIQAGAMFDLGGLRAEDLTKSFCDDTIRAHPRDGVTKELTGMIRDESRAVPKGRFNLLHRCGVVPLMKLNPLKPR